MRSCRSPPPGPLRSGHEPGALQGAAGGGGRRRSRRSADFRPARPACRPREGDRFGRPDRTLARAPVRGGPRRCGGGGGGRSGADAEVCIPGLAGLRPAPCVARRAPLHPLHRTRRHAVLRSFQQHRRPATTLRVGWSSDLSLGSTRTRRLRERPSSSASPKGPRPFCVALCRRRHRRPARPVRFFRREKGRLTRKSGAAYTAPPDAVRKKNGAGRTDFPRFRKVDLAKAEVLDFSSKGNYESDY